MHTDENFLENLYSLYDEVIWFLVKPIKTKMFLILLERAVNKTILQHEKLLHSQLSFKLAIMSEGMSRANIQFFSDIHFYFICWTEVDKFYKQLVKQSPIFKLSEKSEFDLKKHRDFRNHLEHIDERILENVTDLGNMSDNTFTFNGKYIDISTKDIMILHSVYREIISIIQENFEIHPGKRFMVV